MESAEHPDRRTMGSSASVGANQTPADERHPHQWYDDDFCSGGGTFIGKGSAQVACPVCAEMMDVDGDGYLFKHRPHIPKPSL